MNRYVVNRDGLMVILDPCGGATCHTEDGTIVQRLEFPTQEEGAGLFNGMGWREITPLAV